MNISDYLIDQSGKNWAELLSGWSARLPASFTVWILYRFGDEFAVYEDGSVNFLDVGICTVERVADDREDFARKLDIDDNAQNWLMVSLVDQCVAAGLTLAGNQCYGWKTLPILGGEYSLENLYPTDLSVYYSFLADILRQTMDI